MIGSIAGFAGGFAVCWFFKDRIVGFISSVKAKIEALKAKL